jgi:DNA replication protein DnaC
MVVVRVLVFLLRAFLLPRAVLDRLTHRCHILECNGQSYRLADAKRKRRRT